jgi:hypothetical protein
MKCLTGAVAAGIGVFLLFSCAAAGNVKINPNMIADINPVSAGVIEAEFDRAFSSKLAKSEIEAIFYPRSNSVALKFKYQTVTYRQFWDLSARTSFITALEQYKSDYADRNLDRKYRKTRAIYGKTKGRVEWETFNFTKTHAVTTTYEIGYRFREEKPFLSVLALSAKEKTSSSDNSKPLDSQQLSIYFTRAQADELANLFDQAALLELINMKPTQNQEEITMPDSSDEYEEWE